MFAGRRTLGWRSTRPRLLAREGARVAALSVTVRGGSRIGARAVGRRLRLIGRTVGRRLGRGGGARERVLELTGEAGELVRRSVREARALAAQARQRARGRGAQRKLAAARATGAGRRSWPRRSSSRSASGSPGSRSPIGVVSLADPDARPIRKGKLGKPCEFGYVFQLAELTPNTRRGARGLILPAASRIGSPNESELLPATVAELTRLRLRPREVALDGGFPAEAANSAFAGSAVFIAGRQQPRSRRPRKRLAGYRVGCEARISHLKRRYGMRRSRLRGHRGARTWVGWAILAYNLDTLTVQHHLTHSPTARSPRASNSQKRPRPARPFHCSAPTTLSGANS